MRFELSAALRTEQGADVNVSPRSAAIRTQRFRGMSELLLRNPCLYPADLVVGEDRCVSGDNQWWLIHTKPRQEKKLADEMLRSQIAHYLPVTYCKAISRGRDRYAWLPLFPGYMFLQCNSEGRLAALKTNRVVAIQPVADPLLLRRQLATLADLIENGVPLRVEERLEPGREVEVKSGTLKGKRGVVIRRGGKTRLFIAIAELIGGVSLELEIEHHRIEPC
jgi:transcription antitermination factor NusG